MLRDFLIESRCRRGHTSSVAARGVTRELVDGVIGLLVASESTCRWPLTDEGDECGATCSHTISELGSSDVAEESRRAFRIAETLPSQRAVIPPDDLPGPRSSRPPIPRNPPSSVAPPPPSGSMVAGD